jgi:lipopolysaccharide biosynthesis protein
MNKKTLITFVHFNREDKIFNENLNFFQKVGVIENENYHFNFVINSETGIENIIPRKNVSAIQGHNKGYDFGAYKQSLDSVNLNEYNYFIFMNDTCRGPFIPDYVPSSLTWVDMFLDKIDDKVKMVGPTWWTMGRHRFLQRQLGIRRGQNTHIQSYCFGVDKVALNLLLTNNKFDTENKTKNTVIVEHEIGCSRLLIDNGYELKPFQISKYCSDHNADVNYHNNYFGTTINPLEIMFIKTNRINDQIVENYTKWFMQK